MVFTVVFLHELPFIMFAHLSVLKLLRDQPRAVVPPRTVFYIVPTQY